MDSVSSGSGSSSGSGPETATLAVARVLPAVVPSFAMRIGPANYVASLIHSVAEFFDSATIKATDEGLVIRELSPARDFMMEVLIGRDGADEYVIRGEPSVTLNFRALSGILADAKVTVHDCLILGYDNRSKLFRLTVERPDGSQKTVLFNPFFTVREPFPPLDLKLEGIAYLDSETLGNAVKELSKASRYAQITMSPEGVTLSAKKDPGEELRFQFKVGTREATLVKTPYEITGRYDVEVLRRVLKHLVKMAPSVDLEMGVGKPAKFAFSTARGWLVVYLSPVA